jgi:hypothetical protein
LNAELTGYAKKIQAPKSQVSCSKIRRFLLFIVAYLQAEEIIHYHSHEISTAAFQRFKPHLLMPGIVPPSTGSRLFDVSIASPLFRQCKLMCEKGGRYSDRLGGYTAVAGFRLVRVQAIVLDIHDNNGYVARQNKLAKLKQHAGGRFNPSLNDLSLQQIDVLYMLREQFLERPPGTESYEPNSFYCFHGPKFDHLEKICMGGLVAAKDLDAGKFGSGCYGTLNIEYALRYACG